MKQQRRNQFKDQQKKLWAKARIAGFFLVCVPYVRLVALNGSLARGEAIIDSDIDFLIITKSDRIWTARALTVLSMAILGLKRYPNKIAGRVCLNLYQAENHLEFTTKNRDLALSHSWTFPFWSSPELFDKFRASNDWLKNFGIDFKINYRPGVLDKTVTLIATTIRLIGEFLFDLIFNNWGEEWFKKYQTRRILNDQRTLSAPKGAIFISDQELRFHPPKIGARSSE